MTLNLNKILKKISYNKIFYNNSKKSSVFTGYEKIQI